MIRLTALIEIDGQSPRALTHESQAPAIIIGRDASADFQIPLSTISRQHARISITDDFYIIEDLGSTHGTLVNGKRVEKGEKKILRTGDLIEMTRAKITTNIEQEEKAAGPAVEEGTQAIAAKAVRGILNMLGDERSEGPYLRVISGPQEGARLPLAGTVTDWTLGRSKECEFVLDDPNVSRRHAEIKKDWHGYNIHDLGSKNGVLINDKLIQKPRRLKDKDEIVIGPVKLVFVDPDAGLLDALKDVPGFEADDPAGDDDPPHIGAPTEDAGEAAAAQGADGVENAAGEQGAGGAGAGEAGAGDGAGAELGEPSVGPLGTDDADADADLSAIDPELLTPARSKFPVEWLVIGLGGALLIAVILLVVFLVF